MTDVKWLSPPEMRAWLATIELSGRLFEQLDAELRTEAGLDLDDYEILVHLSESPERRMRMSELADSVFFSRSRLTYRVTRLADEGLVCRETCAEDGRGVEAVLTDDGFALLERTAPLHLRGVREHLIDLLSPDELDVYGEVCARVAGHLRTVRRC